MLVVLPVLIGFLIGGAAYFIIISTMNIFYSARPTLHTHLPAAKTGLAKLVSSQVIKNISASINRPFAKLPYLQRIQNHTEFLGLPFGALEVLLIKELLMVGIGILSFVLFSPAFALAGVLIGFMLPDFILTSKVKQKKEHIVKVFPETVDILDLCIGAGLDFLSALRWIIDKSQPNPFIEQLAIVLNEVQVGKSRTDALRDMAKRVNLPDINSFTRTLVQADRMGISIEEALRNLSEDTRMTRFQRGERYAIKASLKILIPLLFCILPVILIVVAGPVIIKFTEGGLLPSGGVIK
jgi:pilus assembly protein TadC